MAGPAARAAAANEDLLAAQTETDVSGAAMPVETHEQVCALRPFRSGILDNPDVSGALRLGEEGGGARVARPWSGFAPWLVLLLDFALLAGLAAEGSVLTQRGGARYLLEPAVALLAYLAVVILTARRDWRSAPTRVALIAGMLTAVMWMISLTVETFADLSGWPSIAATGPLLLGAFVVWGAVGAVAG